MLMVAFLLSQRPLSADLTALAGSARNIYPVGIYKRLKRFSRCGVNPQFAFHERVKNDHVQPVLRLGDQ
jgi:hypothetical protein